MPRLWPARSRAPRAPIRAPLIKASKRCSAFFRRRSVFCQLWWQRLLFEPVGVDIECVTIIVSTFMLGLGSGALAAREIADRYQARRVELIALIERAAALLGECSPWFIHAASAAVVNSKGENP
jgi:hypothetical protein